jgi:hypothetical protein
MSEIRKIIAEAIKEGPPKGAYQCQYCTQTFVKETTLSAHQCEPKRRAQQKNETGVQLGLQAWLRFYELTQGSAKFKTYEDFAKNQFYTAFVKFGRHCHSIHAINAGKFIDYVLKKNIKVDHWCRDQHYEEYLFGLLRTEAAQDALERSIKTMVSWSEETNEPFNSYFQKVSASRFVQHVRAGRVSPWAIYCCDSGTELLATLSEEQVTLIWPWIDPEFWRKRLKDYAADAELARLVLREAEI